MVRYIVLIPLQVIEEIAAIRLVEVMVIVIMAAMLVGVEVATVIIRIALVQQLI
jgi:hypothetical protein